MDRRFPVIIRVELVACAVAFLLAAPTHLGLHIAGAAEPRIVDAAVVEALCGAGLTVAAIGVFARATWAWPAAVTAHAVAIAGVLLGIVALASGLGPSTELNFVYHRVILTVLVAGLLLLLSPPGRRALRGGHGQQPGHYRDAA